MIRPKNMDAKILIESFKGDLTCSICLGYFTDPVIVKCGHTFCKECLLPCWKEDQKPISCPTCKAIITFGDFYCDLKLQDLAVVGKMLRPFLLQSTRDLTTCEEHGKEETFFCVEDHRPLCGPCFLDTDHKRHTVLPLEQAVVQCLEKLQATWNILKSKKKECQSKLEQEKGKEALWKLKGQSFKYVVVSEYEKMHQFLLEQEELHLKRLDKEARDKLPDEEINVGHFQENPNLKMYPEQQPVEMLKLEFQAMIWSVKSEFEKKHQFLSEKELLHLQSLDQQIGDNLSKFQENKAKISLQIYNLQMAMSETEKEFEKFPIEMLLDARGTLERNKKLLLQYAAVASSRLTKHPIPDRTEMLLTFHREITLDPETANPHLTLSDDLKSVEFVFVPQDVPDNPKRFDFAFCVLATQSFISGKHYWEVEVGNKSGWEVGICKESIRRKGNVCNLSKERRTLVAWRFENDFLFCYSYYFIFVAPPIHKVGIFLDYERGHISFYNATDGVLIYSPPNDAFEGPLCPFFSPCFRRGQSPSEPLRICPRSN